MSGLTTDSIIYRNPPIHHKEFIGKHEWWYGATGTGKTHLLHERYPDHYAKPKESYNWKGYKGQKVIALDHRGPMELNPIRFALLRWTKRQKLGKWKNVGKVRLPADCKIIIITNHYVTDCFKKDDTLNKIMNRFEFVYFNHKYV